MKNDVTGDVIYDVIDGSAQSPSLVHSLNVFLQDVGSGKSVSCIVWENTLPSICILKRLPISIYISHGNLLKNRCSGNPTSRYRRDLKLRTHVHNSYMTRGTA